MTGLGGDCFALIKPAGSERILWPSTARAGRRRRWTPRRCAQLVTTVDAASSALPVTVPGAIDALLHGCRSAWGKLGLADSLAPAIRYMEDGPARRAPRRLRLRDVPRRAARRGAAALSAWTGCPRRPATCCVLPGQAEVLRRIARDGREGVL
jgi:gamma-glutamyltranspeptidase/glutathione hydrolase